MDPGAAIGRRTAHPREATLKPVVLTILTLLPDMARRVR